MGFVILKYNSDNCSVVHPVTRNITETSGNTDKGIITRIYSSLQLVTGLARMVRRFYAFYFMVKLYKGSVSAIVQQYGWKGLRAYKFALELKSLLPYSYLSGYSRNIKTISALLGIDTRTFKSRVQNLKKFDFAYFEKDTLRILSNNHIKKHYTNSKRYTEHIRTDIRKAITAQPIIPSLNRQTKAIRFKNRTDANKWASNSSEYSTSYLLSPVLSQSTASRLLGYKSPKSGYNALKYLQHHTLVRIENNCVEVTKEAYNAYKMAGCRNILIKGKGIDAKFYLCRVNNVIPVKQALITTEHKIKTSWCTNSYFFLF